MAKPNVATTHSGPGMPHRSPRPHSTESQRFCGMGFEKKLELHSQQGNSNQVGLVVKNSCVLGGTPGATFWVSKGTTTT